MESDATSQYFLPSGLADDFEDPSSPTAAMTNVNVFPLNRGLIKRQQPQGHSFNANRSPFQTRRGGNGSRSFGSPKNRRDRAPRPVGEREFVLQPRQSPVKILTLSPSSPPTLSPALTHQASPALVHQQPLSVLTLQPGSFTSFTSSSSTSVSSARSAFAQPFYPSSTSAPFGQSSFSQLPPRSSFLPPKSPTLPTQSTPSSFPSPSKTGKPSPPPGPGSRPSTPKKSPKKPATPKPGSREPETPKSPMPRVLGIAKRGTLDHFPPLTPSTASQSAALTSPSAPGTAQGFPPSFPPLPRARALGFNNSDYLGSLNACSSSSSSWSPSPASSSWSPPPPFEPASSCSSAPAASVSCCNVMLSLEGSSPALLSHSSRLSGTSPCSAPRSLLSSPHSSLALPPAATSLACSCSAASPSLLPTPPGFSCFSASSSSSSSSNGSNASATSPCPIVLVYPASRPRASTADYPLPTPAPAAPPRARSSSAISLSPSSPISLFPPPSCHPSSPSLTSPLSPLLSPPTILASTNSATIPLSSSPSSLPDTRQTVAAPSKRSPALASEAAPLPRLAPLPPLHGSGDTKKRERNVHINTSSPSPMNARRLSTPPSDAGESSLSPSASATMSVSSVSVSSSFASTDAADLVVSPDSGSAKTIVASSCASTPNSVSSTAKASCGTTTTTLSSPSSCPSPSSSGAFGVASPSGFSQPSAGKKGKKTIQKQPPRPPSPSLSTSSNPSSNPSSTPTSITSTSSSVVNASCVPATANTGLPPSGRKTGRPTLPISVAPLPLSARAQSSPSSKGPIASASPVSEGNRKTRRLSNSSNRRGSDSSDRSEVRTEPISGAQKRPSPVRLVPQGGSTSTSPVHTPTGSWSSVHSVHSSVHSPTSPATSSSSSSSVAGVSVSPDLTGTSLGGNLSALLSKRHGRTTSCALVCSLLLDCWRLLAFSLWRILKSFKMGMQVAAFTVADDHHLAFCFIFLYIFPSLTHVLNVWFPPWVAPCLWYAFLFQVVCVPGNPFLSMLRVLLPVLFLTEGVSQSSFLLDLNGAERIIVAFVLTAFRTRQYYRVEFLLTLSVGTLVSLLCGTSVLIQWWVFILALVANYRGVKEAA